MTDIITPSISANTHPRFPSLSNRRLPPCFISAELMLADSGVPLEGVVMTLEPAGALFRECTTYLLDRRKQRATLRLGAEERTCTIKRTTKRGYIVRFDEPLSTSIVDDLVKRYPLPH